MYPTEPKSCAGAMIVSKNPYNIPVVISNVVFDVHLLFPMKWTFQNDVMTGLKPVTCTETATEECFMHRA